MDDIRFVSDITVDFSPGVGIGGNSKRDGGGEGRMDEWYKGRTYERNQETRGGQERNQVCLHEKK